MAAQDIIDSVYSDAVVSLNEAAAFANVLTSLNYPSSINDIFLSPNINDQPNYNVTYNISGAPITATPTVTNANVPIFDQALANIGAFQEIVIPDFTQVSPELIFPNEVALSDVDLPNTRPELDAIEVPNAPSLTIPTLPTLANVVVPDDVNVVIPTFDYTFDLQRPTAPTNTFSFNEQVYNSTLLNKALSLVESDIENGGYGLRAEDELNLWNRGKDRINNAVESELDEAEGNIASRGFSMPAGAQNALIQRATQNKTAQLSALNNEIAIKRADLYVQARQFAVTTGFNAQQFLMTFHNQVQERALSANRALADYGIAYFDASVRDYQNELERYRTEAGIFESKLRAALSSLDIYKSRLDAARIKGQINQDAIELYNAQFRGLEALTNIYNSQLQGVRVKAELQELKFRVYGEDIKAYLAALEADSRKVQNYKAMIDAQGAKVDLFRAQTQAHNTLLEGSKIKADIQNSRIQTEINQAELKLKAFGAKIETWTKQYQSTLSNAELLLRKHGIDVDQWRAENQIKLDEQEVRAKNHVSNIDNLVKTREFNVDKYKANINTILQVFDGISKNYAEAARVNGQLASASYNALNAIAAVIE